MKFSQAEPTSKLNELEVGNEEEVVDALNIWVCCLEDLIRLKRFFD